MKDEVSGVLVESFPQLDGAIVDYIASALHEADAEDVATSEGVYDVVAPLIADAGGSEADIVKLCDRLSGMFVAQVDGGKRAPALTKITPLNAPVLMSELNAQLDSEVREMNSMWMDRRVNDIARVDPEKLEKAEARLRAKQEKKANKDDSAAAAGGIREDEVPIANCVLAKDVSGGKTRDIRIESFDLSYGGKTLLNGAALNMAYGRRYGLVGRNGIGKTTILRSLSGRQVPLPPTLSVLHVEQEVVGDDTGALQSVLESDTVREGLLREEREIQAELGARKARGDSADDTPLATRLTEVYTRLSEMESDKAPARASEILCGLGFTAEMQKMATRQFSGGWRMRLALARALFLRPDLLLLDEPTNMLDMNAVIWLETYLQTWPGTILVVSHDRDFLNAITTDTIHMWSQRLDAYKGNYEQFDRTRTERQLNQQREYESQLMYRQHLQEFIDRWRYNAKRAAQAQSKIKILEKLPVLVPVEIDAPVVFEFPNPDKLGPPILEFTDVGFHYEPSKPIFKCVNFGATMESRVALVGANGNGKSTLLKLLTGELEPVTGTVNRKGKLRLGYFSQHHVDQLNLDVCAVEHLQAKYPGKTVEEYRRQLGCYGITGEVGLQPIRTLSGGQKSRVAFADIGMQAPHLLILDEPTNHLDVETVDALARAIAKFSGGVVLVSHDERLITSACNELWICENKSVTKFDGGFREYKSKLVTDAAALLQR